MLKTITSLLEHLIYLLYVQKWSKAIFSSNAIYFLPLVAHGISRERFYRPRQLSVNRCFSNAMLTSNKTESWEDINVSTQTVKMQKGSRGWDLWEGLQRGTSSSMRPKEKVWTPDASWSQQLCLFSMMTDTMTSPTDNSCLEQQTSSTTIEMNVPKNDPLRVIQTGQRMDLRQKPTQKVEHKGKTQRGECLPNRSDREDKC